MSERTITEADAELIAEKLREQLSKDLKLEVGNVVIKWLRKTFWSVLLVVIGAYASAHGYAPQGLGK